MSRRIILGFLGVAVIVAAVGLLASAWRRAENRARLPKPPAATGQPTAITEHLRLRFDAAVAEPTAGATVGALCTAYHAEMYFDLADRCYAVAADLDPREWKWIYGRALIQAERGGGEALVAMLRHVVAGAPQFGPAWLRLGDAEFKAGRHEAAGVAWQRATELPEPERPGGRAEHVVEVPIAAYASLGLARIALARGDAERAGMILETVAARVPGFGSAFRLLADSYRALGRDEDAARAVYQANRRPPFAPYADPIVDGLARESRNSTFLLRLASESNLSVNGPWSEYLTRRAAEFDPDNPEVVVKLGRILRTFGRNEEALTWFQKYHQLVPEDLQGLAHIGSCLSALGRYDEAESFFRRALAGLDDPVTHYNLGLLLAVTGRLDEAVTEYERALDRDPQNSDARGNLATALARSGRLDRAVRELLYIVEHDPDNELARANLGFILMQQGRTREAAVQLEEALRLAPGLTTVAEALATLK